MDTTYSNYMFFNPPPQSSIHPMLLNYRDSLLLPLLFSFMCAFSQIMAVLFSLISRLHCHETQVSKYSQVMCYQQIFRDVQETMNYSSLHFQLYFEMAYINEIFHFALVWRSRRDRSKPVTFKAQEMVMVFGGRRGHHYKRSIMKEA